MIERNMDALRVRADGYRHELTSMKMQKSLLDEEFQAKSTLFKKGLIRGPEMKSIQRAIADAEGNIGRLTAEIGEIQIQITKYEEQIRQTTNAYRQAALDELQSAEADLDSVSEESRQAEDILKRTTIDAPVSGTVIRMYYHTSGGVIESGKAILEILPSGVPLIIEAQVPRTQIDNVHVGQKASVRLTALNRRTTPILDGDVFYVSADALPVGSGDGLQDFYLARVEIPAKELARVPGFAPTPGMPAEILIETTERTFFAYLVKPIRDSMSRAFMEP
jgi:HlyD family secretion protein